ncbi:PepSY domain-containing protein, partial [Duganella sp. HSC-15S17]|nr:PepSY domain-containing protein [Duganella violaceicalia]
MRSPDNSKLPSRSSGRWVSMSRPGNKIRASLFQVHSIAGLVLALLLALIALTGSVMSFEDEIVEHLN